MKKIIICLSVWAGLAACSREEAGLPADGIHPVTFLGYVQDAAPGTRALAGAAEEPKEELITNSYNPVYIRRTAEQRYETSDYKDMADAAEFSVFLNGTLTPSEGGVWYWSEFHQLFHAWTVPTNNENNPLVSVEDNGRFGKVEDFSMKERHEYVYVQDGGARDTTYFLSNLEYFIGAVKGPVTKSSNTTGLSVTLPFKHLVAKIVVVSISFIDHDGASKALAKKDKVPFYMPNMPLRAYWTTGVPETVSDWETCEAVEPKVTLTPPDGSGYSELGEADFGVDGTLSPGDAFYIYPCTFSDTNISGTFGDIQFRYNNSWFYGSLETITGVKELNAGDCLGVTLQLKDGTVKGLYPHIVDWNVAEEQKLPQHDRPGIYDANEWKMFVDWLREWEKNNEVAPPAGIFADDGNLNLYANLDLTADGDASYADIGDLLKNYFTEKGKKLKGNGHRIKTNTQWSEDLKDCIDNLYITAGGKNEYFEKQS